jgi:two-component system sensor histidine kinase PhcS
MSVLGGMAGVRELSAEKQRAFESFYALNVNHKLRPLFTDLSLVLIILGTLIESLLYIVSLERGSLTWSSFHPFTYAYWGMAFFLLGVNRYSSLRQKSPLMLYFVFAFITVFAYRRFILKGGGIEPIFGLFFVTAFLGFSTASLKHSIGIISMNLLALSASCWLVFGHESGFVEVFKLLSNWFIYNCIFMGLTISVFTRWMWRNMFAMQYLRNENNEALKTAFKTLKKTEKQLIQQQKYQALNHMAKGLLHEIINPVNSASQALSYAQSVNEDEEIAEAISEAIMQQTRISNIVTDLRVFAQPESDQAIERVNISDMIAKALKFCHQELDKAEVHVVLNLAEETYLDCHPSALVQVFVNLLLNSRDAFKNKKGLGDETYTREISVSSYEQSEHILIIFKDNGVGIAQSIIQKITDPFFSDENSPEKMGLGLSICQTIIRHHGGTLDIDSKVNEWTEITLSLPAQIKVNSPANKQRTAASQTLIDRIG